MICIKNVKGSKELAIPLIIQKTTVYIKKNIEQNAENSELYQWDEYQYSISEYIELLQKELTQKDLDNKIAIAEIYEMLNNKG